MCHRWAPPEAAAKWDNVGLQIGNEAALISSITLSLDVDNNLLKHEKDHPSDLVITHHPVFFKSISHIHYDTDIGRIIYHFISNNGHLFTMHTNLDAAKDGVNDCLVRKYHLTPIANTIDGHLGRFVDNSDNISIDTFINTLPCQVIGPAPSIPKRVGFCGGSGRSLLHHARELGIDLFITGELNYHDQVWCEMNGLTVLLLGHKASEVPVLPMIRQKLLASFPDLTIRLVGDEE